MRYWALYKKGLVLWVILTLATNYPVIKGAGASSAEIEVKWSRTSNPSVDFDWANGIVVDGSGVYVVGFDRSLGNDEWRIEKRNLTDGSLIWSRTSNPSAYEDRATGVAVDSSGIYVIGYDSFYGIGDAEWRIEKRRLTDGEVMWNKTINPSPSLDTALSVTVDGSGVYIVGYDCFPGNGEWRMEKRRLNDGGLIWIQTSNPSGSWDVANGVAVDASGIYVAGYDCSLGNWELRLEKRCLTDGALLWSRTSDPSSYDDNAVGVAVDGSGVYVVGYDGSSGNTEWRIEKRGLADGSLLWEVTSNPSAYDDRAQRVAVDGSGIYVVGYSSFYGSSNPEWRIEKRRLTDGSLLWSRTSNPSSGDDRARGVAVDGSGIYVAGIDYSPGNWEWRVEKIFKSNKIVVISSFSEIPVETLKPLTDQWTLEGYVYEFVDVNQSRNYPGRDNAEKLRNYLHTKHDADPFTYLFLIDIVYSNKTYIIPARVFWPGQGIYKWWNDYYFANLYGDFDVNQNGIYGENHSDMINIGDYQIIVGRLVLESSNQIQQLLNYINSDIIYRTKKLSMKSSFIIYRELEAGGWHPPVIENFTRLMDDLGYDVFPHIYNYSSAIDVAQALNISNFMYFAGHGSWISQQIGWHEGKPDNEGPWIDLDDFNTTIELNEPAAIIFGGCNTGEVYELSNPEQARPTLAIANAPMIHSKIPAVMVVANTGPGGVFGDIHQRIIKLSVIEPMAKAVLDDHVRHLSAPYNWPYAFSWGYFGDPTLKLMNYLNLNSFDKIFSNNSVRVVYPSDDPSKPLGCGAAWISDWTASSFVSTKLQNYTEGLDTSAGFVNQTSGKPIGGDGVGIISFGGCFVNPLVKYAESDGTPEADRAPVKFYLDGSTFRFQYKNGTNIPGAELPQSVINDDQDMFVIEVYRDGDGRYMMLCYGFGWKGTYAAGKYFHTLIYPNPDKFNVGWMIVKWDDANANGFVNNPGDGDTYTIIASGP